MKPRPFVYDAPTSLDEALAILASDPDDSKVLAGGQSLIPMMNFRLASPARLVDINRVPGLSGIETVGDEVVIATRTRHIEVQNNGLGGPLGSLLRKAAGYVGHLPIRTRGTFGGSIAHCDAASEWCLVASLLDAKMTAASQSRGERTIAAADFFQSIFTTALEPDEILVRVALPALDDTWHTGIAEFARRAGDFGIITTTVALKIIDDVVSEARVSIGGVGEVPFRSAAAEQCLTGQPMTDGLLVSAAEAAADEVDPPSDTHGDAAYRRDLVRALLPRALGRATTVGA
ncbi:MULTISPECIES: xanthine dehydrogenase family protein subunit M [unclassified Mycolicibacterium]|uniref:FAD binding domain-containing protein n=1 Tax=unclassified Mycolicibacterium TaxID=2636767 RepID=UPI0012DEC1AD|nr:MULTISPECIES: xanthine dehydrogenase family protein subunit M [unclassified Mycolicibacterium]MUL80673.1 xanthine dehydrogenase family protein subunit M [Mycolicibacterium sp. CBMA 329]MUL86440.1 xanthine dehydrogenase family protein subunit M [Mycolicibacterium sp. CBMA 331]MUM01302.1 xanthine dehydrogenase family protein subunit M [Mycolicibacterium sp. CBMA 334]MUM29038.1 xanthine dehydrogenase family protein subunit M [Mycolicibacterium sp. CBMA 295]MUM36736.1 xanthine dehydrogenase fam